MPQRTITTLQCKYKGGLVECAMGRIISRALQLRFYLGDCCVNGHKAETIEHGVIDKSFRYVSNGQCKICADMGRKP